jgi:hypothetical protein
VESGPALLHSAGRADCLHCGGGCVLFDWAPISGNAPTGRASVTEGASTSDNWLEILFGAELYVRHCHENWGDGCPRASCIAAMIVRVYGSLATQRISGGQLIVMERVLADDQFA